MESDSKATNLNHNSGHNNSSTSNDMTAEIEPSPRKNGGDHQTQMVHKKKRNKKIVLIPILVVLMIFVAFFIKKYFAIEMIKITNSYNDISVPKYSNSKKSTTSSGPLQINFGRNIFETGKYKGDEIKINYKAYYDITGVVTSTKDYSDSGIFGKLAPIDVCMAWGDTANMYRAGEITFSQSANRQGRLCRINNNEINERIYDWSHNHLIPSSSEILDQISSLEPGDEVRLIGYLVKAEYKGRVIDSGMYKNDTKCEVIYVTEVDKIYRTIGL